MSKLVMIDSQIIIWGLKSIASEGQEDMIPRAKDFIEWLSEHDYKIIVPVPQLSELLSFASLPEQGEIRNLFDKKFQIVPFDEIAGLKCAELLYLSLNTEELKSYRLEQKVPKQKLKYDCMITASAITRGCSKIYSHDKDIRRFASGQIDVSEMPIFKPHYDMFEQEIGKHVVFPEAEEAHMSKEAPIEEGLSRIGKPIVRKEDDDKG